MEMWVGQILLDGFSRIVEDYQYGWIKETNKSDADNSV